MYICMCSRYLPPEGETRTAGSTKVFDLRMWFYSDTSSIWKTGPEHSRGRECNRGSPFEMKMSTI
jgi:hypothetical protein